MTISSEGGACSGGSARGGARTLLLALVAVISVFALVAGPAFAREGVNTTVDETVDGTGHCHNGNPTVNCNQYDGKQYVWAYYGAVDVESGANGNQYFFAVLAPGGQNDANDGASDNLSCGPYGCNGGAYTSRTFTVDTNGRIDAYTGTPAIHTFDPANQLVRLYPYEDTPNPGGVYIMAICSLANGYPVSASDCSYDAFKVVTAGTHGKPTFAALRYVSNLESTRHGASVTLRWTVRSAAGLAGFDLFAGSQRLNRAPIALHGVGAYHFNAHYGGHAAFSLHVILRDGHVQAIGTR